MEILFVVIIAIVLYFVFASKKEYEEFKTNTKSLKELFSENKFLLVDKIGWVEYSKNGRKSIERSNQKFEFDLKSSSVVLSEFLAGILSNGKKDLTILSEMPGRGNDKVFLVSSIENTSLQVIITLSDNSIFLFKDDFNYVKMELDAAWIIKNKRPIMAKSESHQINNFEELFNNQQKIIVFTKIKKINIVLDANTGRDLNLFNCEGNVFKIDLSGKKVEVEQALSEQIFNGFYKFSITEVRDEGRATVYDLLPDTTNSKGDKFHSFLGPFRMFVGKEILGFHNPILDTIIRIHVTDSFVKIIQKKSPISADIKSHTNVDTIIFGNQIWMKNSLDVDRFRNGDLIKEAKTDEEWISAGQNEEPAWCYYGKDKAEKQYKLYNWYSVNDKRGLAPLGFRIPKQSDFKVSEELFDKKNRLKMEYYDNEQLFISKYSPSEVLEIINPVTPFSSISFSQRLPGFDNLLRIPSICLWTSTEINKTEAMVSCFLPSLFLRIHYEINPKINGYHVRCLKQ